MWLNRRFFKIKEQFNKDLHLKVFGLNTKVFVGFCLNNNICVPDASLWSQTQTALPPFVNFL